MAALNVWYSGFVTTVRSNLLPPSSALLNFVHASRSFEMSEQARNAALPKTTDDSYCVIACWCWEQGGQVDRQADRQAGRRPVRVQCFVWPSSFVP
jgi:hypothetical protein